ncbi:hypothetical protein HDU93_009653, partial [Gonapodya sp. JEL0774]
MAGPKSAAHSSTVAVANIVSGSLKGPRHPTSQTSPAKAAFQLTLGGTQGRRTFSRSNLVSPNFERIYRDRDLAVVAAGLVIHEYLEPE